MKSYITRVRDKKIRMAVLHWKQGLLCDKDNYGRLLCIIFVCIRLLFVERTYIRKNTIDLFFLFCKNVAISNNIDPTYVQSDLDLHYLQKII